MIIGPGDPREPAEDRSRKTEAARRKKARKREARERAAKAEAVPDVDVRVAPEDGAAESEDVLTEPGGALDPVAVPRDVGLPLAPQDPVDAPADAAPLVGRIAALQGRVDGLLALVDAARPPVDRGADPVPGHRDGPAGTGRSAGASADPDPPATEDDVAPTVDGATVVPAPAVGDTTALPATEVADATSRTSATGTDQPVAPRLPPVRPSAVLVARELLAAGTPSDEVRDRLRSGYGVEDPGAVLERAAGA